MNTNLKIGDLICFHEKRDSIGYIITPNGQFSKGTEETKWVSVRWLEGEYKGQGWFSVGQEMLSLITDKKIIEEFNTNYPFENNNSFKGTINLLTNDFFNK